MSSLFRTCGGLPSEQTVEDILDQGGLSSHSFADSFGDGFMVADVASMTPKFGWWNVVDGVMLQRFSSNKPQDVSQRWLRLEKKAAKVGKGLFKNGKGKELVRQHWLEAIDPQHRYGHNLRFYFEEWRHSKTKEPFFYWLDSGEGKDLDLEMCTKATLQNERIRYLSPKEREHYEVVVEEGKLVYKETREPVNTTKGEKWIFVMSTSGVLYIGKKEKGALQHSSFLAGAAITAAGRLRVKHGIIKLVEAHSGHYRPTEDNFKQLITILSSIGADLTRAKIQFSSEEMMKKSDSSKSVEVEEKTIQIDTDTIATNSPSPKFKGTKDAINVHSEEEHAQEEAILRDLRRLRLNGTHDIYKQEPCIDQGESGNDAMSSLSKSGLSLEQNGLGRMRGTFPEHGQQSTSSEAESREPAAQSENSVGVEKFQLERACSGSGEYDPDHVQCRRVQVVQYAAKEPSVQDEEIDRREH
ncbi:hypothetical protein MPTK1_4g19780 [Marchantia polymorpha subsp. ruderalis]|uniref:Uncharacterized protein n=2 Tax=Marchantia polymorpha TaxID=3197 RepID=A0AAF6BBQ9_MARPO|nr:hypothetical protein MARPO_0126s0016 [Marchantia polymorpha]BBN09443.1 hypothetical protein Mp_4g19780 [Marchantia polymorpha subsp. ruderalis]|eukprot:PTQ30299.1 hypothetical protein MARPO_0126s0016 [Marchantia polymorpha]